MKIGSSSITTRNSDGIVDVNLELIEKLARGIDDLIRHGFEVIVVASGAVAAGMHHDGLVDRPSDPFVLGELASVGQPILMKLISEEFSKYSRTIAQVLPERASYNDEIRRKRMFEIRRRQLDKGRIVFINENDPVVGDELTFGDNDFVAALESIGMKAKYIIMFTDQNGIYNGDPASGKSAELLEHIQEVNHDLFAAIGAGNDLGSGGGSQSKIYAADVARHSGVTPIVANAMYIDETIKLINGQIKSTRFSLVHDTHFDLNYACHILEKIAEPYSQGSKTIDVSNYYRDIESIAASIERS